jgi:hypothetical protein
VSLARLKPHWTTLLATDLDAVRARPWNPRRYVRSVRRWRSTRQRLQSARHVFRVAIDVPAKHRLLALYKSQGFVTYDTYSRAEEYLYADESLRQLVASSFSQCLSS